MKNPFAPTKREIRAVLSAANWKYSHQYFGVPVSPNVDGTFFVAGDLEFGGKQKTLNHVSLEEVIEAVWNQTTNKGNG